MNNLVQYQNYLKTSDELPKYITLKQYQELRKQPKKLYADKELPNKKNSFLMLRDRMLLDFAWETGGRIGDITKIRKSHINFDDKILTLYMHKSRRTIKINLSSDLCYELLQFYQQYRGREPFEMTPTNAWYIVQKYGKMIDIKLHPHMFRHGLAMYLLSKGVPIPIISYRLGHTSTKTTMDMYMKVTPEIENQYMSEVEFR